MTGTDAADGGRVPVAVPDHPEALPDWGPLEELLATLAHWEDQPVPEGMEPMRLRPPVTGGIARQAVGQVLARVVGERGAAAGWIGRLLSPATGRQAGAVVRPGALIERTPLRIVHITAAQACVLAALTGDGRR